MVTKAFLKGRSQTLNLQGKSWNPYKLESIENQHRMKFTEAPLKRMGKTVNLI